MSITVFILTLNKFFKQILSLGCRNRFVKSKSSLNGGSVPYNFFVTFAGTKNIVRYTEEFVK